MDYFVVDAEGNIVRTGTCQDVLFDQQGGPGLTVIAGRANGIAQFFVDGRLQNYSAAQIESRLRIRNGFRWSRGQWIDERTLVAAKADKWREFKQIRDQHEFGGFMVGVYEFDSDSVSQARITAAMQAALDARSLGEPFSINWTLKDGSQVTLTRVQVIAVGRALFSHINAQHERAQQLKVAIALATSVEELEALTW